MAGQIISQRRQAVRIWKSDSGWISCLLLNPQTVGKIDRRLGKPICWLLTVLRRIMGWVTPRPSEQPVRKILFLKMIEQGATVLACKALTTAVARVGAQNVYFWVFEENRPILDLLEIIPPQNVIVIRTGSALRLMSSMLGTLWRVRKMGIDATVDMEFFSRAAAILAFLSGAKRRVGLHRFNSEGPYRGDLLTHRMQYNPYVHVAIQYHLLVEAIWADPRQMPMLKVPLSPIHGGDYDPPRFKPAEQECQEVREILAKRLGLEPGQPIVLLNPNASDLLPLRKWETARFVELGRRLLAENPSLCLVITGAPSEQASAETVAASIGADRCASVAGYTTLRQLMTLYTLADVLVTNDSGPGHFSSLTDIDSVVLFGPETPALFGPLGSHTHVIWANLACSPCVNVLNHRFSPCNDNVCMQQIAVESVNNKVNELLQQRDTSSHQLPILS
jgi:ADP-heptose:LPS heptosyltransferase